MASSNESHNVMIIDDEPDILAVLELMLKKWGFQVEVFTDPLNALEKFRANPQDYDLTITDIRMPSMNGIELANNIRTLRDDMLVLYISAFERDHEALEPIHGKQLAEDLLKKPVKMADLCAAVRKRIPAN